MAHAATATRQPQRKAVYILRLEGENYYVGATGDLDHRLEKHISGQGAAWTRRHPPIELTASSEAVTHWQQLEREVTLQMMDRYGWSNVRGGPWTKRELDSPPTALDDRTQETE